MGLFDFFTTVVDCPHCGERRAKKSLFGRLRCPNRKCRAFDVGLMNELAAMGEYVGHDWDTLAEGRPPDSLRATSPQRNRRARKRRRRASRQHFDPVHHRLEVRYRNYRGEYKVFVGDARSVRRRNAHYSLCVEPNGQRIALARDRIENLAEVEQHAAQIPTPFEQQVLTYHLVRGTTSQRFEELRRRYPHWTG
jgi:hypothetical protein